MKKQNTTQNNKDEKINFNEIFDDSAESSFANQNEIMKTDENLSSYELICAQKLESNEEPLSKVVGHDNQKKELLLVIDWFKRSKELKAKGVSIPKGVILFGEPGNGKSLLMKEIIRYVEAPVFVFQGEQLNVVDGIIKTFRKAREAGHAIIVIDELDLLINKEKRVVRALQECLDGVESSDDILVLAATNHMRDIPDPLLRHGRLEKLIKIPYPTGEEALELLKKHFKEFNVKLPGDFDDEEIALSLNGITCAGVKAVVNDLVLRNGFDNITIDMLFGSIYNITDRVKDAPEEDNLDVAIHEAGHAVVAKSFPEYFTINRLNISGASGEFHAKELVKGFWTEDKLIANIKISMAGILSQRIICKKWSMGSCSDLENARHTAYRAFNVEGFSSCWEQLPGYSGRTETPIKRRNMERKIEKFLRKCEKETKQYIKSHKSQIKALGQLLFEKKHLKSSEIISCIG